MSNEPNKKKISTSDIIESLSDISCEDLAKIISEARKLLDTNITDNEKSSYITFTFDHADNNMTTDVSHVSLTDIISAHEKLSEIIKSEIAKNMPSACIAIALPAIEFMSSMANELGESDSSDPLSDILNSIFNNNQSAAESFSSLWEKEENNNE